MMDPSSVPQRQFLFFFFICFFFISSLCHSPLESRPAPRRRFSWKLHRTTFGHQFVVVIAIVFADMIEAPCLLKPLSWYLRQSFLVPAFLLFPCRVA